MKKILGLGIAALLIMAMVGGGTWAYFVDVETSTGNILTAGTLDLGLANFPTDATNGSISATWTSPTGWKPGDNVTATLNVKNSGTIAMNSVNVTFGYVFTNGTPTTVSGWNGVANTDNLTKMIKASVATWNGTGSAVATSFQGWVLGDGAGTLSNGSMNLGSLSPGQQAALRIAFLFDPTATNGCQGDSENITLTLSAIQ